MIIAKSKGSLLRNDTNFLIENFGKYAIDEICLSIDDQEIIQILNKPIVDAIWIPTKALMQQLEAAEKTYGSGDYKLCRKIGFYTAIHSIPKFYQIFLKFGDPHYMFKRAKSFWKMVHNTGFMEIIKKEDKTAVLGIMDFKECKKGFCMGSFIGFLHAIAQMYGFESVDIDKSKCILNKDEYCEYVITWENKHT